MRIPVFSFSISEFAADLRQRRGRYRYMSALVFGLVAALGFAPLGVFPFLWICFPALILLLRGTTTYRTAFATGWCFAFGYFVLGLYWIAASMFVDIKQFWWAVPLAVAGLPAFLALFYGFASMAARWFGLRGIVGALNFALMWFLADYTRGHILTGFPWNLEGYMWFKVLPMLQVTSLIGIYGLTLLTLCAACLPASLAELTGFNIRMVVGSFLLLLSLCGWGAWHLIDPAYLPTATLGRVRVVQPNIDQAHKWVAGERETNFRHLLELSSPPTKKTISMVVWPETASTFYLTEEFYHRMAIAKSIPPRATLLTGVIRHEPEANGKVNYYNSLVSVDHNASVTGVYDKFHLVPFGEYIPFRNTVPLHALAALGMDFSSGPGVRTLRVEGLPAFSPLICYEAIFPDEVIDEKERPQFIVNITNDGWYGHTAGPHQHFATVRVRAIEEGLSLVRSANTGISAVLDPLGRIDGYLPLGKDGYVDADLVAPVEPTFYARHRNFPLVTAVTLLALIAFVRRKNSRDL